MSRSLKTKEFHQSFILELAFVGLATIVCMITTRYLLFHYVPSIVNPPVIQYTDTTEGMKSGE
jgi:hypothetical protein